MCSFQSKFWSLDRVTRTLTFKLNLLIFFEGMEKSTYGNIVFPTDHKSWSDFQTDDSLQWKKTHLTECLIINQDKVGLLVIWVFIVYQHPLFTPKLECAMLKMSGHAILGIIFLRFQKISWSRQKCCHAVEADNNTYA